MARIDGRKYNELRPLRITPDYTRFAEGSVLIEQGDTRIVCTASIEEGVPRHIKGTGSGWITAEYAMLPRANRTRTPRDISKLKISGRSAEIQRLIGRSLRSVIDVSRIGENTMIIDCDVIQADGGTRCASITGGYVAMFLACRRMLADRALRNMPLTDCVAAVSAGVIAMDGRDQAVLDMCYEEDSTAAVDFNLVMTGAGRYVELQGTGEGRPYSAEEMNNILRISQEAFTQLFTAQKQITGELH